MRTRRAHLTRGSDRTLELRSSAMAAARRGGRATKCHLSRARQIGYRLCLMETVGRFAASHHARRPERPAFPAKSERGCLHHYTHTR